MAEAVVEDPSRFFCHNCVREINRVLPDYTCPRCCSGFIEALEGESPGLDQAEEDLDSEDDSQAWEVLNDVLFLGMNGDPLLDIRRNGRGRRHLERRQRSRLVLENLVHHFVRNFNDVGGQGGLLAGRGGVLGHEFIIGNPGDYAWNREGFDAIVTQLLNQIDPTGPPPLPKDKISEIPIVSITQEQVDTALQCSVCWENFKLDEPVRQLMCAHVYHEGCIIPWLELHGTCPVCRKPLCPEAEQTSDDDGGRRETIRNLAAQFDDPSSSQALDQLRESINRVSQIRSRLNNSAMDTILRPTDEADAQQQSTNSTSAPSTSSSQASRSADANSSTSTNTGNASSSQDYFEQMDLD